MVSWIVIGVLYMKNMNPGPTLFTQNPQNIYAVYLLFIVANLIMIPLGWACIKVSKRILQVPRNILMPVILLFCIVGSFAINNTPFDIGVMLNDQRVQKESSARFLNPSLAFLIADNPRAT